LTVPPHDPSPSARDGRPAAHPRLPRRRRPALPLRRHGSTGDRRDRGLGYALSARILWALGADPRFTDLLIRFPDASRLRDEARIALRYLRVDCRGL